MTGHGLVRGERRTAGSVAAEAGESVDGVAGGIDWAGFVFNAAAAFFGFAGGVVGLGFKGADEVAAFVGDAEAVGEEEDVDGVDAVLDGGVGGLGFDGEAAAAEQGEVGFGGVGGGALAGGGVGDGDDVGAFQVDGVGGLDEADQGGGVFGGVFGDEVEFGAAAD